MVDGTFATIREGSEVEKIVRGTYFEGGRIQYVADFEDGAMQIDTVKWAIPGNVIEGNIHQIKVRDGKVVSVGKGRISTYRRAGEDDFFNMEKATLEGNF